MSPPRSAHVPAPRRSAAPAPPAIAPRAARSRGGLASVQSTIGTRAVGHVLGAHGGEPATVPVAEVVAASGSPLDARTAARMQSGFGENFSSVRVHTGPGATAAARSVRANAFTYGHHVVVADPNFSTGSPDGQRLLAHELAHVVQQRGAAITANPRVESNSGFAERQARGAAGAVLRGQQATALTRLPQAVVQREPEDDKDQADESLNRLESGLLSGFSEGATSATPSLKPLVHGGLTGLYVEVRHQLRKGKGGKFLSRVLRATPGDALSYGKGYIWGFLQGLWSPVSGLIDLVKLGFKLQQMQMQAIANIIQNPKEIGDAVDAVIAKGRKVSDSAHKFWESFKKNPTESIGRMMSALSAGAFETAKKGGHKAGKAIFQFLEESWDKIGEGVGKVVGTVAIEAALAFATEGIGNVLTKIGTVLDKVAPTLMKGVRFVAAEAGAIMSELHRLVEVIKKTISGAGKSLLKGFEELVGESIGLLDDFIALMKKLFTKIDDAAKAATHAPGPHAPAPHVTAPPAPKPAVHAPATKPATPHVDPPPAKKVRVGVDEPPQSGNRLRVDADAPPSSGVRDTVPQPAKRMQQPQPDRAPAPKSEPRPTAKSEPGASQRQQTKTKEPTPDDKAELLDDLGDYRRAPDEPPVARTDDVRKKPDLDEHPTEADKRTEEWLKKNDPKHQQQKGPDPEHSMSGSTTPGERLRADMRKNGIEILDDEHAHHMVPSKGGGEVGDRARKVLDDAGIKLDEGFNGVGLKGPKPDPRLPEDLAARHLKIHTKKYYQALAEELEMVAGQPREVVLAKLADIRALIKMDRFPY